LYHVSNQSLILKKLNYPNLSLESKIKNTINQLNFFIKGCG
jgi:hypothetical protein